MRSISTATWLSLATGWLTAAAAISVLAIVPDEAPGIALVPAQPPSGAAPQHDTGKVPAGLVGPRGALVTLSTKSAR